MSKHKIDALGRRAINPTVKNLRQAYQSYVKSFTRIKDQGIFDEMLPTGNYSAYIKSHDKLIRTLYAYLERQK